eukprot:scaffold34921_cov236-Isochrysis_galbana.AAC.4
MVVSRTNTRRSAFPRSPSTSRAFTAGLSELGNGEWGARGGVGRHTRGRKWQVGRAGGGMAASACGVWQGRSGRGRFWILDVVCPPPPWHMLRTRTRTHAAEK